MKYELVNQGAKQDRSERVNRGVVMKKDRIYGYRRSRGRPSFNAVVVSALLVLIGGIVTPSVHAAASVALAGDSTVASGTGWGDALLAHLSSGSTVNNQAVGGRSTKSFMDEGKWSSAVNLDRDYVFIQFGHNDQKLDDTARGTHPSESTPTNYTPRSRDMFRANLLQMVNDVRAEGGIPVLVTSVARRNHTVVEPGVYDFNNDSPGAPDADGNAYSLLDYVEATLAVAASNNVAVIDLNQLSLELYTEMLNNGEDITTLGPDGDNTHFNSTGAMAIAALVAEAIPTVLPGSSLMDPVNGITITPASRTEGEVTDYGTEFTPNASETTDVTFDFSAFGTGVGSGADLTAVSTDMNDYIFGGFSINPTSISIDNTNKTIVFAGGTTAAGKVHTIINAVPGTGWRMTNPPSDRQEVEVRVDSGTGTVSLTFTGSSFITTADGNGADTYTTEHLPTENNGANSMIWARWSTGSRNDHLVLRFDLAGLTGQVVNQATLKLAKYRDTDAGPVDIYVVNDGAAGDALEDWSEMNLTYNNAPWVNQDGSIDDSDLDMTVLTKIEDNVDTTGVKGERLVFSESAALLDALTNDSNGLVTFVITGESTDSGSTDQFASQEATALDGGLPSGLAGDFAPVLELSLSPVEILVNRPATEVTSTSVVLNAVLTSGGESFDVTAHYWVENSEVINTITLSEVSAPASIDLSVPVDGLEANQTYWFTFEATSATANVLATPALSFVSSAAPVFTSDSFSGPDATVGVAYAASIASQATDAEMDTLTFTQLAGPEWVTVDANGDVGGTPGPGDVGVSVVTVGVSDPYGGTDTATMNILVWPQTANELDNTTTLITALSDTYISEKADSQDSNFGSDDALNVRLSNTAGTSNDRNEQIVLRFDVSSLSNRSITSATLELVKARDAESGQAMHLYGVSNGELGDALADWSESTLTYNNAPWIIQDVAIDGTDFTNTVTDSLVSVAPSGESGDTNVLSSLGLLNFIEADTNGVVTLILARADGSSTQDRYASKETTALADGGGSGLAGDFAPRLIVNYLPAEPEIENGDPSGITPTSAVLNGHLKSTGLSTTAAVSVLWGTADGGADPGAWSNTDSLGTSDASVPLPVSYSTNMEGLLPDNAYYYTFTASNDYGMTVASPSEVFITGDVWVEATDPDAHEDGDPAVFTISRPNLATNRALVVNYSLSGTSSNGVDYAALDGTATIPAGALSVTVTVNPILDGVYEANETVVLSLEAGGYCIGSQSSASAVIANDARVVAFYGADGQGAEGAGRWSTGGRGGDVYVVTNLNDSGPGSLREAIDASGPRTVVFEVSGTIYLESDLSITNDNITIAGQTAPGDGICLAGRQLMVEANDVLIRFIRVRPGDNAGVEVDAIWVRSGTNIVLDHCSASWSVDETLSVSDDARDVTVQWCMITESLNNSVHSKGEHGYASLIRSHHGAAISFHHNLFAHHKARNPRPGNYLSHTEDPDGQLLDFRNNVIFNWGGTYGGYNVDTDSVSKYNFINNYYVRGPNSSGSEAFYESCPYSQAYFAGNWMQHSEPSDPWDLVIGTTGGDYKQSQAFEVAPVTTDTAPEAYTKVLAYSGAAFKRDSVDSRVVTTVLNGTGGIIDDEQDVGGWPTLSATTAPVDTDRDGMPDDWELARGLDPNSASDRNDDRLGDGYTNLEEYLNGIAFGKLCTITLAAGTGGTLSPSDDFTVGYGSSTNIEITPDTYWTISGILLDGVAQPVTNTFSLSDVLKDHTLSVSFAPDMTTSNPTPHWWLDKHGFTNFEADVTSDTDQDGMAAWEEYLAGTDPTDPASVFRILDFSTTGGTNRISWYATTNSNVHTPFTIEYTTTLIDPSWTVLTDDVPRSATGINVWTWPAPSEEVPALFYRITISE